MLLNSSSLDCFMSGGMKFTVQHFMSNSAKVIVLLFQTIEIPSMKVSKKVKSMQMFKKPVDKIVQVCYQVRGLEGGEDGDKKIKVWYPKVLKYWDI